MRDDRQSWIQVFKYHLLYWVVFILLFTWIWGTYDQNYTRNLMVQLWSLPARLTLVYITLWVLVPRLFEKERYLLFAFSTFVLLVLVGVFIQRAVMLFIVEGVYLPYQSEKYFNLSELTNTCIDVGLAAVIPLGYTFFLYWRSSQHEIEKLSLLAHQEKSTKQEQVIHIKAGSVNYRLNTSDIQYIESLRNYLLIKTTHQELIPYGSISEMEARLEGTSFLRVHRSYIVNLEHLNSYTHTSVEVEGKEIPIGRKYKSQLLERLNPDEVNA